jgi:uncharacterized DUF497 family protein
MTFEWDKDKAAANVAKHGIRFDYAARVFDDPYRIEREDSSIDYGESRYQVLGSVAGYVLFVAFTYRGEAIRIISARRATRYERRQYYEISS